MLAVSKQDHARAPKKGGSLALAIGALTLVLINAGLPRPARATNSDFF
jgi:hypothetical protein